MLQYEQYKAINLPWLKEIPANWSVQRNKTVFSEMKEEVGQNSEQYRLLSLTLNGIIHRDIEGGGKFPESFDKYKVVKQGYMAFCLFDVDETPRTVGLSQYDGMLTGAYTIMQVHDINPRYAYYYYLSLDNQKKLRPLYTGLRKTINVNTFQSIKLPIPPHDEQEQIVRFLDWKVSAINRLINVKRKQIKQIESLKKTIIHRVVTKGLHNVRMKDSGIEWIGNIPDNWNVAQVRRCYNVILGKMLSPQPSSMADTWEKYVCAKDVHFDGVSLNDLKSMWFSGAEKKQYQLFDGDLLVVEGGAGAGNSAIVRELKGQKIYVQNSIHIIRPKNPAMLNDYLCYWLTDIVGRGYMNYICSVATIPHFTKDKVMSTMMPIPSVEQQCEIVLYLDEQCAKVDNEITAIKQVCEKLQDLKARLISDVVTGKIDVRGVEVPEFAPVEEEAGTDIVEEEVSE